MFDVSVVQEGLLGLVGVRQPLDPSYAILEADLVASRSGRFLDDVPRYKTQFFIDTQSYPGADPFDVNDQLRNVQRAAIAEVCSHIFGDSGYIDRNLLYSHAATQKTPEASMPAGFVGFKIKPSATKNVAFKITDMRLRFDADYDNPPTLKLLLFHSSEEAPMETKDVVIDSANVKVSLDWVANATAGEYKGEYYLGYISDDANYKPFRRDYELSDIQNELAELCIEKIYATDGTETEIFDASKAFGLSQDTGMNPDITVYNDYSDLILQNEHLLGRAVQLQWAIMVMQQYIATNRSNRNERLAKDIIALTVQQIEGTVFGAPVKVTGLNEELSGELKKLHKVFEDLRFGYEGGRVMVRTLS